MQRGSTQKVIHAVICTRSFLLQEMCNEIMRTMPDAFHCIPDRFKTQEMCIKAVEVDPSFLKFVPDHFKTKEMCDKAMRAVRGRICGMMTIMMMMVIIGIVIIMKNFLNGAKVIKNERLRNQK